MKEETRSAVLYRMVSNEQICPFGIKSKALLQRKGFTVTDNHLKIRSEVDAFKAEHKVSTTPQTFIDGERIGGYDALVKHFGLYSLKQEGITFQPIIAVFGMAFALAIASQFNAQHSFVSVEGLLKVVAFSMSLLALMKLRDLYSFSNQFLNYDLLAQRYVPYAYAYPIFEGLAGLLMIADSLPLLAASISICIGSIGAISVFKAVYIDKRELKCACVGGNSSVPLGGVSLLENLIMFAAGSFMLLRGAACI